MKQNRILYIFLFAAASLYAYFNGGKIPYMLLYTVLLLPLFSFAYTYIIYLRFKYEQVLDRNSATKGETINFTLYLSNEDFFIYPYIKVFFYGEDSVFENQLQNMSFSLLPYSKKTYSRKILCNYRGSYEIGIKTIVIDDFFGLFSFKYNVNEPKYITVYPRIIHLENFKLKTDYISEAHSILNNKDEDMTTISDIRKYAYGDNLRRIHWKLTAKARDIMVKKFQSTSETSAILLLDLRKNDYSFGDNIKIEDKVIESMVAVLYFCLYNWVPVNVVFYNTKLINMYARNYLMFNDAFDILAKVRFNETVQLKDMLEIYTNNALTKTNILLFTSNLDYELYNQIYKTVKSGLDVSLIYTSPQSINGRKIPGEENILNSLPEIGVNCYRIDTDEGIKELLEA